MSDRTGTSTISYTIPSNTITITSRWPTKAKARSCYIASLDLHGINPSLIKLQYGLMSWDLLRQSDGYIADAQHPVLMTPVDADVWSWKLQVTQLDPYVPGTYIKVDVNLNWSLHVPPPLPAAPFGLSASQGFVGYDYKIHVYWMVSSLEDQNYTLERSCGGGAFAQIANVKALVPSTQGANYVDTVGNVHVGNIHPGDEIQYRVRAHNESGDSPYSEILTVIINAFPPVPAVPVGLSASKKAVGSNNVQVHVFWMVTSVADMGYTLERSRGGGGFDQIADVKALVPSTQGANYVDTVGNTYPGEAIRYRVRGYNQSGVSPYSDTLIVTIDASALPVPAAPVGLSASKKAVGNNNVQIHVFWMVTSVGDSGYTLERSRGGGAFGKIGDVRALVPSTQGANYVDTVGNTHPGEAIQYA